MRNPVFRFLQRILWAIGSHVNSIIVPLLVLFVLWNIIGFMVVWLDRRRAMQNRRQMPESALLFFVICGAGIGTFLAMKLFYHQTQKTKLKIAHVIGLSLAFIFLIHVVEGMTLGRIVVYREIDFYSPNWPVALDGYRIGFMADKHRTSDETMRQVIDELNNRNLDLLLLGGDFSMGNNHYIGTLREIAQTITTDGIWGVEGNHDRYQQLFAAKEAFGIGVLNNTGYTIRPGFFLAGVHDLWHREPDIALAITDATPDSFILVISHNPDVSMQQDTTHVDFMLAGHTHGGQVTFFGWPFYLLFGTITQYGTRFAGGFAESLDGSPVFTTVGLVEYYMWPRVFNRPEVVIFTMFHGE